MTLRHLLIAGLLVACRQQEPDPSRRTVTEDNAVRGEPGEWLWGIEVVAGSDLDHDGVLEWATAGPRDSENASERSVVRVFEGREPVTERHPSASYRFSEQFGHHMAAGDVDGDGWADLVVSIAIGTVDPRVYVLLENRSESDATLVSNEPEGQYRSPRGVALLPTAPGGSDVLVQWGTGWYRYDLFPSEAIERGRFVHTNNVDSEVADAKHTVLDDEGNPTGEGLGSISPLDRDGDGVSEAWLGGFWRANGRGPDDPSGNAFVCEATTGLTLPSDCQELGIPYASRIGSWQATGDLTGDGVPELITSVVAANGTDGEVHIFELDGTPLATIQGTHGAMFGWKPTPFVDDTGDPWLLVSQTNLSGDQPGTVRAFRGSQLRGLVLDDDAERTFVHSGSRGLGLSMATYRQTPNAPVQLLLGNPYDGDGVVFMVPFEAP